MCRSARAMQLKPLVPTLSVGKWSAQAPLEAYGRLPAVTDVVLSPDGTKIAFARNEPGGRFVVVEEIGARKPLSVLSVGDQKLRELLWADNVNLIIIVSITKLPTG